MLELLKEYKKSYTYLNFVLNSGEQIDGFITKIMWDDMDDIITIQHPLTKCQATYRLDQIKEISILKT
jgi:hypothetical protein